MIAAIYKNSARVLMKKPLRLWGLSLLTSLLTILITIFGILPIVTIPVTLTLSAGAAIIYLNGYHGKEVYSDQLFSGFKNFPHVAGGMCWKSLWVLIWALIPIVGLVFAVIKTFAYAFVPYILIEKPGISATAALRYSMEKTKGYKGKMFIAWLIPVAAVAVVSLVLALLAMIPYAGVVFSVIRILFTLAYSAVMPLFLGLVSAGFYDMAENYRPLK